MSAELDGAQYNLDTIRETPCDTITALLAVIAALELVVQHCQKYEVKQ